MLCDHVVHQSARRRACGGFGESRHNPGNPLAANYVAGWENRDRAASSGIGGGDGKCGLASHP